MITGKFIIYCLTRKVSVPVEAQHMSALNLTRVYQKHEFFL